MKTFKMSRKIYDAFDVPGFTHDYTYGRKYMYHRLADGTVERMPIYYRNREGQKRREYEEHARRTNNIERGKVKIV